VVEGQRKLSEDVRAIYRAYALKDRQYVEVVELHRYQQIIRRWPLLAELHSKAKGASWFIGSSSNIGAGGE
jgi:hypothetical protein